MTVDQLRTAGQQLMGQLKDYLSANPLVSEYFPDLGAGIMAFSKAIEAALAGLTRSVPASLAQTIRTEYQRVNGATEIGPMLEGELVDLAKDFKGSERELAGAIRTRILDSQETKQTKRAIVDGAYQQILGRAPTPDERARYDKVIDDRLAAGEGLDTIMYQVANQVSADPEVRLLEQVGQIFHGIYPEHDAPTLKTKRHWTNWVQSAMAQGLTEQQALAAVGNAIRG